MGALEMELAEKELQPLVNAWRQSNTRIVRFWWDVDTAVKKVIKERKAQTVKGVKFFYQSGMLFITLPSGRRLVYVKPRMGENRFGGESVTYEGVGGTKKWERIQDARAGKIDLIITKSISRFSRNTVDCLKYTRELKGLNIAVFFEKENINTLDAKGEVLMTIMAALAQQESESLSANVRLGIQFRNR